MIKKRRDRNAPPAEIIPVSQIEYETKRDLPSSEKKMQEIAQLSDEIQKIEGLIFPIVVARTKTEGNATTIYRIKSGWGVKRLEAAKMLGWTKIKAVVIPPLGDEEVIDRFAAIIEKDQRQELSTYDMAKAASEMEGKFDIRISDFADVLGRASSYTYNLVRWYRTVPNEVKDAWRQEHPLATVTNLERISKLDKQSAINQWQRILEMRTAQEPFNPSRRANQNKETPRQGRRASLSQLMKLLDAIEESGLKPEIKSLSTSLIRFALGLQKSVPGITDYKKLPLTLISKEAGGRDGKSAQYD